LYNISKFNAEHFIYKRDQTHGYQFMQSINTLAASIHVIWKNVDDHTFLKKYQELRQISQKSVDNTKTLQINQKPPKTLEHGFILNLAMSKVI